jgi:pimeloyl-ACP methyl ester carboxylesterase
MRKGAKSGWEVIPPGILVPTMPNPPSPERRRIGDLVRVDGHDVHVRQDGPADAPAVVLVHGFACSMHWFDRVAAQLAAEHRVIRVDLLGHGCTSPATQLDAAAQARVMSGVLQRLRTNGATAVGHSFGADVVLAMARRTEHLARVVIIAQAPDYDCSRLPSIAFLPVLPALATLTHRLTPPWMARISNRVGFGPGQHNDNGSDDRSDDPQRIALDRAAMNPRMYRTILVDRRARLAALPLDMQVRDLGMPVLAILGGRDRLYPSAPTAARYRAAGARVVVIDDAGHSVNVQRPAEVAELIRDFAAHPTPG